MKKRRSKMKEETREDQRQEKRREEKREEARQEKRQDEEREREMKEKIFFKKNVPGHSSPPAELAQNVSKKNPRRTNYSSIFPSKVQNLTVFSFIYMIRIRFFWARGINSEWVFRRTVPAPSVPKGLEEKRARRFYFLFLLDLFSVGSFTSSSPMKQALGA